MGNTVIRHNDGSIDFTPARTVIEVEDGVYYSHDADPYPDDFRFHEGAEIVGHVKGEVPEVDAPETPEWLEDALNLVE